jgi:hypothetical protein
VCNGSLLEFRGDGYFLLSSMAVLSGSRIRISTDTLSTATLL